jgi:sec-independent protein translocase protein TatB
MFDIGFTEIILVAIVGLLVVGPERLPEAIRTSSKWLAKLKRGYNTIKADVARELGVDELREQLRNDAITQSFEKDKQKLEALDQQARSANIQLLDSLAAFEEKPSQPGSFNGE